MLDRMSGNIGNFVKNRNKRRMSSLKLAMTLGYTVVMVAVIIIISTLVFNKTDDILKTKVSNMNAALNVQMKLNMDSYLERLEATGTLVFAEEEVYSYSATDDTADSYEAINTEDNISDELYSLCIMENFVDFCIVYSNNHTVGKISNGTNELFGSRIYEDFSAMINRDRTNDGWSAGYNDNFKRIYYVKRINDNAVLVTSFYTSELENVFKHPGGIEDITVRLTDKDNNVIYSSIDEEIGSRLENDIAERIDGQISSTIIDNDYLISVNSCGDDWKVICSAPTEIILKEKNDVQFYIVIIAIALSFVAFLTNILLSRRISEPVKDTVETLALKASMDLLTGLYNKKTYEDIVSETIANSSDGDRYCMLILDLDNFKGINDNLGHAVGDKVLAEVGNILRKQYRSGAYIGRVGGDEFSVMLEIPKKLSDTSEFVKTKCAKLCDAFRNNYADSEKKYKVSVSIGAASFPSDAQSFQTLYANADKALYVSKNSGKDTFSIYSESVTGDE